MDSNLPNVDGNIHMAMVNHLGYGKNDLRCYNGQSAAKSPHLLGGGDAVQRLDVGG